MAVALTFSQSAPGVVASSVRLLAASTDIQPAVDQLVAAQQQMIANNSAYPFITAYDKTTLPAYTQNMASGMLYMAIAEQNLTNSYDLNGEYFPVPWNAPGTNPQPFSNSPNPDDQYSFMVTNDQSVTLTITPKPGTKDVTFVPMSGRPIVGDYAATGVYDLSKFTPNADGSYTITISPTQQSGNWVNTGGASMVLIRDTIGNWGLPHSTLTFQQQGAPSTYTLPVLSNSQITAMLNSVSSNMPASNSSITNYGIQARFDSIPANHFTPIGSTPSIIGGPILPSQMSSAGHFSLQPDQALVVKVPNLASGYSDFQLSNAWMNDLPYVTAQGSLNDTNTFHSSDGYTYYIISSQNPGVANWIDNSGATDGNVFMRFQNVTGTVVDSAVTAQVVPMGSVSQYIPADTPTVTPAQYAASLKQRQLSYDYVRHQMQGSGWVTSTLEIDQIKAAIGTDQFSQIFGSQAQVPSVLDRITNSGLTPDFLALARGVFANPAGSLAAVVNNLPLATQDIVMPVVLASLRFDLLVNKTIAAVQSSLAAGRPSAAFAALAGGVQGLGTLINQTLTDPATSVTAGFLNARDDLSVALTNAGSYSPLSATDIGSVLKQIGQVNQSAAHMLAGGLQGMVPTAGQATTANATTSPTSATVAPATRAVSATAATNVVAPVAAAGPVSAAVSTAVATAAASARASASAQASATTAAKAGAPASATTAAAPASPAAGNSSNQPDTTSPAASTTTAESAKSTPRSTNPKAVTAEGNKRSTDAKNSKTGAGKPPAAATDSKGAGDKQSTDVKSSATGSGKHATESKKS
ncbi:hypothetical protein [Mycolicibacterium sp. HS_4_1]